MNIIKTLMRTKGCILTEFEPSRKGDYLKRLPERIPEDLAELLNSYNEVEIFSTRGQNTWTNSKARDFQSLRPSSKTSWRNKAVASFKLTDTAS